eukprot:g1724.t1
MKNPHHSDDENSPRAIHDPNVRRNQIQRLGNDIERVLVHQKGRRVASSKLDLEDSKDEHEEEKDQEGLKKIKSSTVQPFPLTPRESDETEEETKGPQPSSSSASSQQPSSSQQRSNLIVQDPLPISKLWSDLLQERWFFYIAQACAIEFKWGIYYQAFFRWMPREARRSSSTQESGDASAFFGTKGRTSSNDLTMSTTSRYEICSTLIHIFATLSTFRITPTNNNNQNGDNDSSSQSFSASMWEEKEMLNEVLVSNGAEILYSELIKNELEFFPSSDKVISDEKLQRSMEAKDRTSLVEKDPLVQNIFAETFDAQKAIQDVLRVVLPLYEWRHWKKAGHQTIRRHEIRERINVFLSQIERVTSHLLVHVKTLRCNWDQILAKYPFIRTPGGFISYSQMTSFVKGLTRVPLRICNGGEDEISERDTTRDDKIKKPNPKSHPNPADDGITALQSRNDLSTYLSWSFDQSPRHILSSLVGLFQKFNAQSNQAMSADDLNDELARYLALYFLGPLPRNTKIAEDILLGSRKVLLHSLLLVHDHASTVSRAAADEENEVESSSKMATKEGSQKLRTPSIAEITASRVDEAMLVAKQRLQIVKFFLGLELASFYMEITSLENSKEGYAFTTFHSVVSYISALGRNPKD